MQITVLSGIIYTADSTKFQSADTFLVHKLKPHRRFVNCVPFISPPLGMGFY